MTLVLCLGMNCDGPIVHTLHVLLFGKTPGDNLGHGNVTPFDAVPADCGLTCVHMAFSKPLGQPSCCLWTNCTTKQPYKGKASPEHAPGTLSRYKSWSPHAVAHGQLCKYKNMSAHISPSVSFACSSMASRDYHINFQHTKVQLRMQ